MTRRRSSREDDKDGEEKPSPLHGDILQTILSNVPPLYLLPASHVSKTWHHAAILSSSPALIKPYLLKPWLIVHVQSTRNHANITAHAYDPNSHVWVDITPSPTTPSTSPLRSSNGIPSLLYTLHAPSKLAVSFDTLYDTWHFLDGLKVWRSDPVVAVVGRHVVVAGGTCDFEDDPMAVETYDMDSHQWDRCRSMPPMLEESASAMWLSVAASNEKLFLLEKTSGKFCSFDPRTTTWEAMLDIRPNPAIFFSVIGLLSSDRLILIGLIGDSYKVESLRLWEVDFDTFESKEIAKMPLDLLEKLANTDSSITSIDIATVEGFIYIYNSSYPKDIIYCDFTNGMCQWGSINNLTANNRKLMEKCVFTCSKVGFDDLHKVSRSGNRKLTVKSSIN